MLDALKKILGKPVNPLESPKSAEKWLAKQATATTQLPQTILSLIERSGSDPAVLTAQGLLALRYLDDQLQTPLQMLTYQYVSNPRMSRPVQERIWQDVISIASVMLSAYRRFIQMESEHADELAIDKALPLISGRCLRYLAIEAKWHYFRMESPNSKVWSRAHQLYRLAEVKGFESDPITLYAGNSFLPTTCADEYLQLLLLETVNSGTLLPRQIDLVDQWLNKWTQSLALDRQYNADKHLFVVNLTEPEGVSRCSEEMVGDMCRYVSMQLVVGQITAAIKGLEQGESPAKLDLGAEARSPGSLELLRHLQNAWALQKGKAFKRASERRPARRLVDVIHGVSNLYVAVKLSLDHRRVGESHREEVDYDELVDMKLYGFVSSRTKEKIAQSTYNALNHTVIETESWTVENESEGGFGAVLPSIENDWVRIGSLIGLRENVGEQSGDWQLGVVRRLTKVNSEQLYAGIQMLNYTSFAVKLEGLNKSKTVNLSISGLPDLSGMTEKNGLLMIAEDKQPSLLLQTADYASDKIVKLVGREKIVTVKFKDVKEKGVDWTWAQLEVLGTQDI